MAELNNKSKDLYKILSNTIQENTSLKEEIIKLRKRIVKLEDLVVKTSMTEKIFTESSNLEAATHYSSLNILEIEFKNGSIYRYRDVPESVYSGLLKAESAGKFFNSNIKNGGYSFSKIK